MQIEYDREADALYISLQKKYVSKSKDIGRGIVADLDKQGKVIGIEILECSKKFKPKDILTFSLKDLLPPKKKEGVLA